MRAQFEAIILIANATAQALTAAGVDAEFVSQIDKLITKKAGSYLPPVNGVLHARFDAPVLNKSA